MIEVNFTINLGLVTLVILWIAYGMFVNYQNKYWKGYHRIVFDSFDLDKVSNPSSRKMTEFESKVKCVTTVLFAPLNLAVRMFFGAFTTIDKMIDP